MKKETRDVLVASGALFAMFFGAGNLIFPPALGFLSGSNWFACMLGFTLTGVGIPILGVAAIARCNGSLDAFAGKVSPLFAKVLGAVIVLAIGPLLAIPRTGATVFELGIQPLFPGLPALVASIVYFAITLAFVLKPSGIVDKVGKYLTPTLLAIITLIIAKGVFFPIGSPEAVTMAQPFGKGFVEGYQTMDALASILFAGLVLAAIRAKGYTSQKEILTLTIKSGAIAGLGLMFVYGGLLYLGAASGSLFEDGISKANLIMGITNTVLGSAGQIGMCIAVSAACLTTSIGLTAVVGDYFSELSGGRLSYKGIVIFTCIFSAGVSVSGIEKIIQLSIPLLIIAYPVVIVLIVLALLAKGAGTGIFRGAVFGAMVVSGCDALGFLKIDTGILGQFVAGLPLASSGFSWLLPAIGCAVVFEGISRMTGHHADKTEGQHAA